ncbi:hypothetical protein Ciccas_004761 [Cichlidogyrus casuarinus]|uniref:Peptidase M20 dimerisation domain-containing protein n=1 Tax=Cichlidogyrus casuarinus TaxID=1844966 RepID=A0ABD2QBE1_9PLAT
MAQQRSKSELLYLTSEYIDACYPIYEKLLSELVTFMSISDDPVHRIDVIKAIRWCGTRLENIGCKVTYLSRSNKEEFQKCDAENLQVPFPESLIAELGNDPLKPTLLLYGHVDIKAISVRDEPLADPWSLNICGDYYEAHGLNDGKAGLLCWIAALDAIYKTSILPLNIRFFVEGLGNRSSETVESQLNELRSESLHRVDYAALADGFWLGEQQPCLIYGGRGIVYFYLTVFGPERDLHSGLHGGAVTEPMQDLVYIIQSLVDKTGHVLIQDFYQNVDDPDSTELTRWKDLDFSAGKYEAQTGASGFYTEDKLSLLKRRWVQPELTVHKIEDMDRETFTHRRIPKCAKAKFSVRTVMRMSMEKTIDRVLNHIEQQIASRNSKNQVEIQVFRGGDPFLNDLDCINYTCAKEALTSNWGVRPDLIREGATLPTVSIIERTTSRDVCVFPLAFYSNAEASNNRLPIVNVKKAMKVFASYCIHLGTAYAEMRKIRDARQQKRKEIRDMLI